MQKNNKGFAKLFVVMLAVVFGALAVYFLVGRNISPAVQDIAPTVDGVVTPRVDEKQPDTKNSVVDTSTWKTYTSPDMGFSIQYPVDWLVEKIDPKVSSIPIVTIYSPTNPPGMDKEGNYIEVLIDPRPLSQITNLLSNNKDNQEAITIIDSQKAYQYKNISSKMVTTFVQYKSKVYSIGGVPFDDAIIMKSLSTFKFTK